MKPGRSDECIRFVVTAATHIPCLLTKVDTKDVFLRIFVEEEGQWNFTCVLLKLKNSDSMHIAVPNSMKIRWVESIHVFCTGSETAIDAAENHCKTNVHHQVYSNIACYYQKSNAPKKQ